jgi:hypothetical protein
MSEAKNFELNTRMKSEMKQQNVVSTSNSVYKKAWTFVWHGMIWYGIVWYALILERLEGIFLWNTRKWFEEVLSEWPNSSTIVISQIPNMLYFMCPIDPLPILEKSLF